MSERARRAVVSLHDDLVAWISRGDMDAWAGFEAALAGDFTQIGPDGVLRTRAQVIDAVAALAGTGSDGFTIAIEDATARSLGDAAVLVTYREVHRGGRRPRSNRWSTAVLTTDIGGGAKPKMKWRHLHECWVP